MTIHKDLVRQATNALYRDFDAGRARPLFKDELVQHNPTLPTGLAAVLETLPSMKAENFAYQLHRIITEGSDEGTSTMSDNTDLGEYSKFVRPHWTNEELDSLRIVVGFLQTLKDGALDRLRSDYADHPYVQHNPSMETGIPGVIKEVQKIGQEAPSFFIDTKHVYVDGQFVIIQAHFTAQEEQRGDDSQGFNAVDIWKVVDGKIVEHWDSIQPLGGVPVQNANGIF